MSYQSLLASVLKTYPYPASHFSSPLSRDTGHLSRGLHRRLSPSTGKSDCRAYVKAVSSNCSGWDELLFPTTADSSRDFLVSLGIDDSRNIFAFILGVVIAFAVSRVRVSSIIVIPASALVFAAGFSFGFFHAGPSHIKTNGIKRESKDEMLRSYGENRKILFEFLDGFDAKANDLKTKVLNAIASRAIELNDLKSYVGSIESMESLVSEFRNALEGTMLTLKDLEGGSLEHTRMVRGNSNAIAGVLKKILQPISSLLLKNSGKLNTNDVKEKRNVTQARVDVLPGDDFQRQNKQFDSFVTSNEEEGARFSNGNLLEMDVGMNKVYQRDLEEEGIKHGYSDRITTKFTLSEEFSFQNDGFSYRDGSSRRFVDGKSFNAGDPGRPFRDVESNSSFVRRNTKKSASAFTSSLFKFFEDDDESYRFKSEEGFERCDSVWIEDEEMQGNEYISPKISDDLLFDRCLKEAKNLQKQAKICLNDSCDENNADLLLNKSAKLLREAIAMKPRSLLAVGQLGNTYLLHGELKLRISRELRFIISTRVSNSPENRRGIIEEKHDRVLNKDKLVANLASICEECDELLLEAGRKYRFALSIDGNDVRALYNWGLALSFRAQLIADIGPKAALDADKLFLAAIDKFDAMMSKSNAYAPDALFRWGMTLQQRSRLRPNNSRERVKLLQQAMSLYEDSMNMDNGKHSQAREALLSCASELNYRLR